MSPVFQCLKRCQGTMLEVREPHATTTLRSWMNDELTLPEGAAHLGVVLEGGCELKGLAGTFALSAGMYFSLPGAGRVVGGEGLIFSCRDYQCLFMVGGPVEDRGRLRYINGCTSSLLIPPVLLGDPCLNLLHVPPKVDQTEHEHPSARLGVVLRGSGICRSPEGDTALSPGLVWHIRAGGPHSFHTSEDDLLIVAYHPDSDHGPTHEDHPMLNRTLIWGVSARDVS